MKSWVPNKHSLLLLGALGIGGEGCTLMSETENFPENEWKVPEYTKVLSADDLAQEQPQTGEYGEIVYFNKDSSFARNLVQGDIIISGTTPQFPDGFLRIVVDITRQADYITAITQQASLEEAIEQGRFDAKLNLADAYQQTELREDDIETRTQNLRIDATGEAGLRIVFDKYEITPGITIGGELLLEPRINVMADIGLFTLHEAAVSVEGLEDLTIEVEAAYRESIKRESPQITLAKLKPLTFITPVGIPIMVTPVLSLTYGAEAEAEFSITGTLHQSIHAEFGLSYKKAREPAWQPIANFDHTFEFLYPETPTLEGKVESYVKPRLSFLLYGAAGPNVSLKGTLGAEAAWEQIAIYTTLGVNVGIEVKALSATLADYEVEVYQVRRDLKKIELGGQPGEQCTGRSTRCSADEKQVEVYDSCNRVVERTDCKSLGENYGCEGGECLEHMVEEPAEGEGEEPVVRDWTFVRRISLPYIQLPDGNEVRVGTIDSLAWDGRSLWYLATLDNDNLRGDICILDTATGNPESCLEDMFETSFNYSSIAFANGLLYMLEQEVNGCRNQLFVVDTRDGSKGFIANLSAGLRCDNDDYNSLRLDSLTAYNNELFGFNFVVGDPDLNRFCSITLPDTVRCGEPIDVSGANYIIRIGEEEHLYVNKRGRFGRIHGSFSEGDVQEIERVGSNDRCGDNGNTLVKTGDSVFIGCSNSGRILEYQLR